MLKLDLLVPFVLIVCLVLLAWILSKVFSPEAQTIERGTQSEIVLDPDRYQGGRTAEDTKDLGAATNPNDEDRSPANVSNTTGDADELEDYYQDGSIGQVTDEDEGDDKYYDDREAPSTTTTVQEPKRPATTTTSTTTPKPRRDVKSGEYHVIAGSFRQKVYAQQRVRELKKDGFADAYLGYTNRGAFAVAVAGSSSSAATASDLSAKVRRKGYDNFVKRGE